MKLKFEPSDFVLDMAISTNAEQSARFAQTKFEKWLSEQPVAFGGFYPDGKYPTRFVVDSSHENLHGSTHQCRLVDVREIEKKECQHYPRVIDTGTSECVRCGIKLKAKWEPDNG